MMKKDNLIIDNHGPLKNGSLKDLSELKVEELNQLKADGSAEWELCDYLNYYLIQYSCGNKYVSDNLDVEERTVSRWRNGHTKPNVNQIVAMCFLFKLGYCRSIEFIESADFSLKRYPIYRGLLLNYPYASLNDINSFLENNNLEKLI